MSDLDFVYRFSAPAGYKGKACAIVSQTRPMVGGVESVVVQFEDGERLQCSRTAVVRRRAAAAHAAMEIRASGGLNAKQRRARDARAVRQ